MLNEAYRFQTEFVYEAPVDSRYSWLNGFVFLGTLTPGDSADVPSVTIRVWKLP